MTKISEIIKPTLIDALQKNQVSKVPAEDKAGSKINFADTIKDFLEVVNDNQKEASEKVTQVIQGKSEDLAGAMAALEESRISFQLMLEIRNKLMESYQQIQRMSV